MIAPAIRSSRRRSSAEPVRAALLVLQRQLYQACRVRRQPIAHLMPWLLDRRNLEAAWERVRSADGARTPGRDGVICAEVAPRLGAWLTRLADELLRGTYRPDVPRLVEVPKDRPGGVRRLGILTVRDRVVQAALKQVLEVVLEPTFLPTSFGFRPGRSVPAALDDVVRRLSIQAGPLPRFAAAVPLDVADCFDTVDHHLLLAGLNRHVADDAILALLARILKVGGATVGRLWWRHECGLVQGSALSPLLCNLALHPLDVALAELGHETAGRVAALRYADDLLLLAADPPLARKAVAVARASLGKLRQQARKPLASPSSPSDGVDWLGVRLQPRGLTLNSATAFGYIVPPAKVGQLLDRLDELTQPPDAKIDRGAFNLARWVVSINDQLREWRQAYLFADNAAEVWRLVDDHARDRLGRLLASVTACRQRELGERFRVRLPRGFWTWEVEGARLAVLSALAPHAPGRLVRPPQWMVRGTDRGNGDNGRNHAAVVHDQGHADGEEAL
jgi:RNA-directed DNA polymerase